MNKRPQHTQGNSGDRHRPSNRRRRGGGSGSPTPHRSNHERSNEAKVAVTPAEITIRKQPPKLRNYAVVFYDSHAQAKEDAAELANKKESCDQLNIVIKAEGSMEDPELLKYGKIYAGEAWTLIHRRRVEEGWYNSPHE